MKPKNFLYLLGVTGAAATAAVAGYVASKPDLRNQLRKAKTTSEAMRTFSHHVKRDGKDLSGELREYMEHGELPKHMKRATNTIAKRFQEATEDSAEELRAVRDHAAAKKK